METNFIDEMTNVLNERKAREEAKRNKMNADGKITDQLIDDFVVVLKKSYPLVDFEIIPYGRGNDHKLPFIFGHRITASKNGKPVTLLYLNGYKDYSRCPEFTPNERELNFEHVECRIEHIKKMIIEELNSSFLINKIEELMNDQ